MFFPPISFFLANKTGTKIGLSCVTGSNTVPPASVLPIPTVRLPPSPPPSASSIVQVCQEFLKSHGHASAAAALAELKPSGSSTEVSQPPTPPSRPQGVMHKGDVYPPVYLQFRHFIEWIDHGLEDLRVSQFLFLRWREDISVFVWVAHSPYYMLTSILEFGLAFRMNCSKWGSSFLSKFGSKCWTIQHISVGYPRRLLCVGSLLCWCWNPKSILSFEWLRLFQVFWWCHTPISILRSIDPFRVLAVFFSSPFTPIGRNDDCRRRGAIRCGC